METKAQLERLERILTDIHAVTHQRRRYYLINVEIKVYPDASDPASLLANLCDTLEWDAKFLRSVQDDVEAHRKARARTKR